MSALTTRLRHLDTTVIVYIALIVVLTLSAILVATAGRNLFSPGSIRDILTGMSVLGFVAIGQTLVILAGSLDLSVPYVVSLTSLVAAQVMNGQASMIVPAILLALAVAAVIGLANGLIVSMLKVHGFIATLGVGLLLKGYLDTNFKGTAGSVPWAFQLFGASGLGPIPVSTIVMVALAAAVAFLLARSRFGHHLFAVGGGPEVARLSGVRTQPPIIWAHVLCSVFAGIAGLLLASRLGVGSPTVGTQGGYDLLSIAAVVLGGTLLAGGRGSIWGTIGGVAIFAVLDNLMSVLQVNPFLKDVVRGAVIVIAVAIYSRRSLARRRERFAASGAAVPGSGSSGPSASRLGHELPAPPEASVPHEAAGRHSAAGSGADAPTTGGPTDGSTR